MIAFALWVLLAAARRDEVELVDPFAAEEAAAQQKLKTEEPPPAPTPTSLARRSLVLSIHGIGNVNTGSERAGGGGGAEVGYRIPLFAHRFGFSVGFHVAGLGGGGGDLSTFWWSLTPGLTYHEALGPGLLVARATFAVDYTASVGRDATDRIVDRAIAAGAEISGGYRWQLGPGALATDAFYHLLVKRSLGVEEKTHVFGLRVGYSFFLL